MWAYGVPEAPHGEEKKLLLQSTSEPFKLNFDIFTTNC